MTEMLPLAEMADAVLRTADGREKTALSRHYAGLWQAARARGETPEIGTASPPDRPARPARPELLDPRDVPRRRPGSPQGRRAILHAVAHIELNAVDLHWDIVARFTHIPMPIGFYDDWVKSADEESKHFNLICDVLDAMDCPYGTLPAHAGMWRAAEDTKDDLMGRLAVVPMVLEARGLDVTPGMIEIFEKAKKDEPAAAQAVDAMHVIYAEEVHHVAYGSKWFHFLCGRHDTDPKDAFHDLVRRYFHGALKPPFNEEKRAEAGLPPDFYWPLAD
ncbi:ferritin-like domain-containing protein [Maritalea mobilis]|uniref:ferritin-like domain-containing protein n=1 Tax=Maritalea mobilis TaxID=483324 RepID=UPI001C94DB5B|nr:ferritin-like domain-containing protein [Maritalea mobilis]MBY6200011.1 ferritin-like domain-containing protein [Maritalea mobilis]